jgi:hypothetical protein
MKNTMKFGGDGSAAADEAPKNEKQAIARMNR